MTRDTVILMAVMAMTFMGGYILIDHNADQSKAAATALLNAQNDSARADLERALARIDSMEAAGPDTVLVEVIRQGRVARAGADSTARLAQAVAVVLEGAASVRDSLTQSIELIRLKDVEIRNLRLARVQDSTALHIMAAELHRTRQLVSDLRAPIIAADAALTAERDARACRALGTVKVPCVSIPRPVKCLTLGGAGFLAARELDLPQEAAAGVALGCLLGR